VSLALGGVYVRDADGELVFHAPAPPTSDEVTELAVRTAKRPQKVLARHGRLDSHHVEARVFRGS
jgi:hypothetical protein